MKDVIATIFDIQRLSVHDGPGIRTTVFFKGCPLRCLWCHNPESFSSDKEILFNPKLCTMCGMCEEVCQYDAQKVGEQRHFERDKCVRCGRCVDFCYFNSLKLCGRDVTVDELVQDLIKDKLYYDESGGGVTLSGGEVLMQHEFVRALLKKLKQLEVHIAIDTCGFSPSSRFVEICSKADLILFDLKHMDNEEHKKLTGVGNTLIKKNFELLIKNNINVQVRFPMIKDYNDSDRNIKQMAKFLLNLGINKLDVIPYHDIGVNKYTLLGKEFLRKIDKYKTEEESARLELLRQEGMDIQIL